MHQLALGRRGRSIEIAASAGPTRRRQVATNDDGVESDSGGPRPSSRHGTAAQRRRPGVHTDGVPRFGRRVARRRKQDDCRHDARKHVTARACYCTLHRKHVHVRSDSRRGAHGCFMFNTGSRMASREPLVSVGILEDAGSWLHVHVSLK